MKEASQTKEKQGSYSRLSKKLSNEIGVERHLRLSEVAAVTGLSRSTVWRLLPHIRHIRIAAGGLDRTIVLIPESSLKAFLRARECAGEAS